LAQTDLPARVWNGSVGMVGVECRKWMK
jgi:hypothetical protein